MSLLYPLGCPISYLYPDLYSSSYSTWSKLEIFNHLPQAYFFCVSCIRNSAPQLQPEPKPQCSPSHRIVKSCQCHFLNRSWRSSSLSGVTTSLEHHDLPVDYFPLLPRWRQHFTDWVSPSAVLLFSKSYFSEQRWWISKMQTWSLFKKSCTGY